MFRLRAHQLRMFCDVQNREFQDKTYAHLNRIFPEECEELGEPLLREWILTGLQKAHSYGMTSERQVMCYIDTMFLLDPDFDTSDEYPWARRILKREHASDEWKMLVLDAAVENLARQSREESDK